VKASDLGLLLHPLRRPSSLINCAQILNLYAVLSPSGLGGNSYGHRSVAVVVPGELRLLIAYVDDAGDVQTLKSGSNIQPILAFVCVIVDQSQLAKLTTDFLALKEHHFRGRLTRGPHRLSNILTEIKGAELRTMVRESRKKRRTALLYLRDVMDMLEGIDARVIGRVWIKVPDEPLDGLAMNTYSIQWICEMFQRYLEKKGEQGTIVIDSNNPGVNTKVAHSIFTQKFQASGDCYDRILDMPTFGGSQNHAGLQIADTIASGVVVPMAGRSYCADHVEGSHVHEGYDKISDWLGKKLRHRQFRYREEEIWRGGLVVSDPVGGKHSGHLFRRPAAVTSSGALL
jgi:hypothetical protein